MLLVGVPLGRSPANTTHVISRTLRAEKAQRTWQELAFAASGLL
jgi:hypothetical protein